MDFESSSDTTRTPQLGQSLEHYVAELGSARSILGERKTMWMASEGLAMLRFPTFDTSVPGLDEVKRVLWRTRAAVASYLTTPDQDHLPNTWIYICQDQGYDLEKLSKPARRDVRRALRSLQIGPIEWPSLLDNGSQAFCDTVTRLGLSNASAMDFNTRYRDFSRNSCHRAIGAWAQDSLAAFMTLIVVDDWVEIEGSYFTEEHRGLCPNNGLAHYVLDHFLVQRGFKTVSYGMSSVQDAQLGLHAYKQKVGFDARPVHRVFVLHPLLRPLVNKVTLLGINAALRFRSGDRRLKKARGVVASILGNGRAQFAYDDTRE